MKIKWMFFFLTFFCFGTVLAQDAVTEEQPEGWTKGGGVGFDLGQLLQINPKVGAGENRIGVGGALNMFWKYKKGLVYWDNVSSLNLSVQRLGSGILQGGDKVPFQKSIDELRIGSKLGFVTHEGSKWAYSGDFTFLSQLTSTHLGEEDGGNYLKEVNSTSLNTNLVSKLFSPATVTLSLGMDYKHNDQFSIFLSPLAAKAIIVGDDRLARLGIHGNPWTSATDFENTDMQLGAMAKMQYNGKLGGDKINFNSTLQLYSNYLREPQNIDFDWNNEFAFNIFKGIQVAMMLNFFYDHDVKVQVSDFDLVGGTKGTGRRLSITEQLILKYAFLF